MSEDKSDKEKRLYMEMFACIEAIARANGHVLPNGDADGNWVIENMDTLPEPGKSLLALKISALREFNMRKYGRR